MKKLLILFLAFVIMGTSLVGIAEARTISVKGYYKPSIGKYIMPSYRTSPNKTKIDNYSTKGNYNPYNGKRGTVNPYKLYKLKW